MLSIRPDALRCAALARAPGWGVRPSDVLKRWSVSMAMLMGLMAVSMSVVQAAEVDLDSTTVNGFGTLGVLASSLDGAAPRRNWTQDGHPDSRYSWRTDSRIGVQVSHTIDSQLQLVGQLVARDQPSLGVATSLSRAFISYRPSPNLQLRLGRLADSTFLMSDYSEVGYAFPWVRPPMEAYGIIPPHFYDGGDVTYSLPDDDGVWRIKGMVGRIKSEVRRPDASGFDFDSNDVVGLALIREKGPLQVRIGYTGFHTTKDSHEAASYRPLLQGLAYVTAGTPIAVEAGQLTRLLDYRGKHFGFASLGMMYDDGIWMVQSELNSLTSTALVSPRGQQAYIAAGRHFGPVMPFVSLSAIRASYAPVRAQADWGPYAPLQQGLAALGNSFRAAQQTASLGVRWDVDSRMAVKLQWDHVRVQRDGWALWWLDPSKVDSGQGGHINLLSATLDFVF